MSYLILPNGIPGFQKAIISFWFRVPASTIVNVYNKYQEDLMIPRTSDPATGQQTPAMPRMSGILPFMTFGQVFDGYIVNSARPPDSSSYTGTSWEWDGTIGSEQFIKLSSTIFTYSGVGIQYMPGGANYQNPSFIGLDCTQANSDGTGATLRMRFQCSTFGTPSNTFFGGSSSITDYNSLDFIGGSSPPPPAPPPYFDSAWNFNPPGVPYPGECVTIAVGPPGTPQLNVSGPGADYSIMYAAGNGPDAFDIGGSASALAVTPDQWHHVVVSLDLSMQVSAKGVSNNITTKCGTGASVVSWLNQYPSISDPCQCWLAFDDVNYTNTPDPSTTGNWIPGPNGPISGSLPGLGLNGIAPKLVCAATGFVNAGGDSYTTTSFGTGYATSATTINPGIPGYAYRPADLPTAGYPFGIPCVPDSVSHPYHHVMLAELQVFTGATMDTGVEDNRRKFISDKGRPVDPALTTLVTLPAIGDPTTWDPGADIVVTPPSDPNVPIGKRGLGKPVISLTRTNQNWITPLNLGQAGSKIMRTGRVKPFTPEPQLGK